MAAGFSIKEEKIEEFKDYINKCFLKIKKDLKKNDEIFYDSIISPSALNENFYEEINSLSPFGSGNPEPRFVLDNLKVIRSTIVGHKHVKSILVAKDGSTIKSISFNSHDADLGQFLLNNKSDTFNIAGKLSLNEWKGEKNVEFIIDDISVNKGQKIKVPSSIG